MATLIILDCPEGFPCVVAAMSALPAAKESGHERIRVDKRGHVCEFSVLELEAHLAASERGEAWEPPRSMMWDRRQHEEAGNVMEPRIQVWPGVDTGPNAVNLLDGFGASKAPPSSARR